ncbi:MAG TPA: thioredoxin domain-containing protein [Candidatus Saccharimonadales bacterium]|nr:thioredoxin domain-containing protein [Candidatus Saccharimonadales bacterium]
MDKRFLGILGAIIIIFIAVFAISQHSGNKSGGSTSSSAQPTNHAEGQDKAGVTLLEYGDYECPICEAYYQPLKQAVVPYLSQIHFQFRNLPLTSIHPTAFAAARAAEAAALQGKFWQMHDALYDNQNAWVSSSSPLDLFAQYAQRVGLNVSKFKADYASSQVNDSINADIAAFLNTSYANHDTSKEATPTFFINGKYLSNDNLIDNNGAPSADRIEAAIKAAIDAKTKS